MKKLLLLLAAVGMIFTACENTDIDDDAPKASISLSEQSLSFTCEGGEQLVSITSTCSWEASSRAEWVHVSPAENIAGTKTLTLTIDKNSATEERSATVVIKNIDYNLVSELYILQEAFAPKIEAPESVALLCDGGDREVEIVANVEYEFAVDAEWLAVKRSEKGITLTAEKYSKLEPRTAKITLTNEEYNLSKEIAVTQSAAEPSIKVEPATLSFEGAGGTRTVEVTANVEYEFTADAEWLTIERIDVGLSITAALSLEEESRTATITVSSEAHGLTREIKVSQAKSIATRAIIYTTTDNKKLFPYTTEPAIFGAIIVSNTYEDGQGVIMFDGNITSIGAQAFYNCTTLASITIPVTATTIGDGAFYGCSSLASVTIPDSVTSIGSSAFYNCYSLTSVTIPDSVTSIGSSAFYNCSSLTSVTIPDSVTEIGDRAFSGCSSLTSVTIPDSVTSIGGAAFSSCSSLASVTIPDSVTSIGGSAFSNCSSLASVTIPNSVTSIGVSAFYNCSSLTNVTIGNSVTSIGDRAFNSCSSLTSVTIPDSVTSIGGAAFSSCSSLKEVYCKPTTPPTGANFMFYNNASGRKIYVPTASVSAYKAASGWSSYASYIVGYEF